MAQNGTSLARRLAQVSAAGSLLLKSAAARAGFWRRELARGRLSRIRFTVPD
jgi:hypothetical protein